MRLRILFSNRGMSLPGALAFSAGVALVVVGFTQLTALRSQRIQELEESQTGQKFDRMIGEVLFRRTADFMVDSVDTNTCGSESKTSAFLSELLTGTLAINGAVLKPITLDDYVYPMPPPPEGGKEDPRSFIQAINDDDLASVRLSQRCQRQSFQTGKWTENSASFYYCMRVAPLQDGQASLFFQKHEVYVETIFTLNNLNTEKVIRCKDMDGLSLGYRGGLMKYAIWYRERPELNSSATPPKFRRMASYQNDMLHLYE